MKKKIWSGRFRKETNVDAENFSSSIDIDKALYTFDIKGSISHVEMLSKQKIISSVEKNKIVKGLKKIQKEIDLDKFNFSHQLEDIHMNIEDSLSKKIGSTGKKVHTARSRNDQVATDIKLYIKDVGKSLLDNVNRLQRTILKKSEKNIDVIIPFYTHLQRAQPILVSHYLLAYLEMFIRDVDRINQAITRLNQSPLGSCAGSGTSFNIDRFYTAKKLGFKEPTRNSIDSVSDRDYVIDTIYCCSVLMMHLSRFCEDLIIWNSSEFNFITIGDEFTTGSSIMPQKKNPDILELIRGKTGGVYGNLVSILTNLKGLPLSYNRDLQEDKSPLFESMQTSIESVNIFTKTLESIKFNNNKIKIGLNEGFLTATDIADYLAKKNIPFRVAHNTTGKIVAYCEKNNKNLNSLSINELKKFSSLIEKDIFNFIEINKSVSSKKSYGGTSKTNVKKMITKYKKILSN